MNNSNPLITICLDMTSSGGQGDIDAGTFDEQVGSSFKRIAGSPFGKQGIKAEGKGAPQE
jgi:hypothetical protein